MKGAVSNQLQERRQEQQQSDKGDQAPLQSLQVCKKEKKKKEKQHFDSFSMTSATLSAAALCDSRVSDHKERRDLARELPTAGRGAAEQPP